MGKKLHYRRGYALHAWSVTLVKSLFCVKILLDYTVNTNGMFLLHSIECNTVTVPELRNSH